MVLCFSPASRLVSRLLHSTMMYGKKLGRFVRKYSSTQVEPTTSTKRRWSVSSSSRGSSGCSSDCDSDSWDSSTSVEYAPAGVPEGCLAVYVGPEMQRFVVQARFLCHQVFRELLRRSEEEYGFESEGALRIPCEAAVFQKLLWELESEHS